MSDGHGGTQQTQVYVKVLGTNDAPVISVATAGGDHGAVTEDAVKTTASGSLTFTDVDVGGSGGETWSVDPKTPGAYGMLAIDQHGHWTYTLDNARAITQALTAGQTVHETFTVTVTDSEHATATHTVTIDVTGTGEGAHIAGTDVGALTEDKGVTAGHLATGGTLTVTDADPGEAAFTPVTSGTGHYGTFTLDAQGHWTYTADNSQGAVQQLGPGQHLTDTLAVTSVDGTTHDITVTIAGTNDAPTIVGTAVGHVHEDGTSHASGTLTVVDPDGKSQLEILGSGTGKYGALTLDQATGVWTYNLDNAAAQELHQNEVVQESFTVRTTDASGVSVQQTVTIEVTGQVDAPRLSGAFAGAVTEDTQTVAHGTIVATDPDKGDTVTLQHLAYLDHSNWGTFSIDAQTGDWTFKLDPVAAQSLQAGQIEHVTFVVSAQDDTRTTSHHDVTITITGTNDAPIVSGVSTVPAGVEDRSQVVTTQNLLAHATDVDSGDTLHVTGLTADHGTFTDNQDGTWTFHPEQNYNGRVALSYDITDGQGGNTPAHAELQLSPTNDIAVIAGGDVGSVMQDQHLTGHNLTTDGTLTVTDADPGEAAFTPVAAGVGHYGTFTLDAHGYWTYTADNSQAAVQQLTSQQHLTDTLTVTSVDGTTHDITVTIEGTNHGSGNAVVYTGAGAIAPAPSPSQDQPAEGTATADIRISIHEAPGAPNGVHPESGTNESHHGGGHDHAGVEGPLQHDGGMPLDPYLVAAGYRAPQVEGDHHSQDSDPLHTSVPDTTAHNASDPHHATEDGATHATAQSDSHPVHAGQESDDPMAHYLGAVGHGEPSGEHVAMLPELSHYMQSVGVDPASLPAAEPHADHVSELLDTSGDPNHPTDVGHEIGSPPVDASHDIIADHHLDHLPPDVNHDTNYG